MTKNYSISQALSYHSLDLNKRQHEIIRAMQELDRRGEPAYRRAIAREIGVESGSVCQAIEDLLAKEAITFDTYVKSSSGKQVESYKLVSKGQNSLI